MSVYISKRKCTSKGKKMCFGKTFRKCVDVLLNCAVINVD